MEREEFREQVRLALESLPPELRAAMNNVEVVVEDENPDDPDIYGFYWGIPLIDREGYSGALPDKISIYQIRSKRSSATIPSSCARRSASPSCTSSPTTSASTRTASKSSAGPDGTCRMV